MQQAVASQATDSPSRPAASPPKALTLTPARRKHHVELIEALSKGVTPEIRNTTLKTLDAVYGISDVEIPALLIEVARTRGREHVSTYLQSRRALRMRERRS